MSFCSSVQIKQYWFRILTVLVLMVACLFGTASSSTAAQRAVLFNPSGVFLENPLANERLSAILTARGYSVSTLNQDADLEKALDDHETALVVYSPCESTTEGVSARLKSFLYRGGIVITGGGMPFWYIGDSKGALLRSGTSAQVETASVQGGFIGAGQAQLSELGRRIFSVETTPSGVRALTTAEKDCLLIPLASHAGAHPVALVSYPGNGKLLYGGTFSLDKGLLNPVGNEAVWSRLLDCLETPLPRAEVSISRDDWLVGKDKAISASYILENPTAKPITFSGKTVLTKDAEFGFPHAPVVLAPESITLAPGQKLRREIKVPLPQARYWGVYRLELVSDLGFKAGVTFHVLPPAALAYIDIDPIYPQNPAATRSVTVGVRSNLASQKVKVRIETRSYKNDREKWKIFGERELELRRTSKSNITAFTIQMKAPGHDVIVRASVVKDGQVVHDSTNRIEYADHNRALDRRDAMTRAMDGYQLTDPVEAKPLRQNLLDWRKEMPLFDSVQPASLSGDGREWLRENGFISNYGAMLTNYPRMEEWKLDDRNGVGISALQLMPGHPEEVTSWLVAQHSRQRFQGIIDAKPDIVNLVEAVAGYETPGIIPNRKGDHSHFLGYSPAAIPNYREALAGRDEGVRMLDAGGKRIKRYHFAQLYELLYDDKFPTPQQLGFKSWDEYVPLRLTLAEEGGVFKNRVEEVKYRLHYYLRSYFHMKRLDDLTVNLRALAPEVHCVIGHDGPLVAQVSSQYYRLPYIDTQTRWLFRSAYIHALNTTYGSERTWIETAHRFGRRIGVHEEIGAGQWASYRTAETSFVSLFTKRAALPYDDLQVDFFHSMFKAYRLAEEKAMYKGFQLAVDSAAKPSSAAAQVLIVANNNTYYPANYRGNYRWDLKTPESRILTLNDFTVRAGIPSHIVETPVWDTRLLEPYRIVCLSAERYMKGDLKVVNSWLRNPKTAGRVLFINHASPLQIDYHNGFRIDQLGWRSEAGWAELGLSLGKPTLVEANALVAGSKRFALRVPLKCLAVKAPANAVVLLKSEKGTPIVWQIKVGRNSVVYSGLPAGNIMLKDDPDSVTYAALNEIFKSLGCAPVFMVSPGGWFGCGYRLKGDRLAIALMNPAEQKIADQGPYGADGDKVEEVAAALGTTEVGIEWRGGGVPNRTYKIRDAWTNELLPTTLTADAKGNIKTTFKANVAKLYMLE